jgi:hypothetical protein
MKTITEDEEKRLRKKMKSRREGGVKVFGAFES